VTRDHHVKLHRLSSDELRLGQTVLPSSELCYEPQLIFKVSNLTTKTLAHDRQAEFDKPCSLL
jgi:hypothetical protein